MITLSSTTMSCETENAPRNCSDGTRGPRYHLTTMASCDTLPIKHSGVASSQALHGLRFVAALSRPRIGTVSTPGLTRTKRAPNLSGPLTPTPRSLRQSSPRPAAPPIIAPTNAAAASSAVGSVKMKRGYGAVAARPISSKACPLALATGVLGGNYPFPRSARRINTPSMQDSRISCP